MDEKLQLLGFLPLDDDACVYTKGSGSQISILIVHVDDFIIAAPTDAEVSNIANGIKGFFPIKDLGEPAVFLGYALSRDYANGTITMSQTAYVHEILKKADISSDSDLLGVETPILPS
ncbi:hypothetical protein PENARI_c026G06050 [Penicillium arizonense]|uniref:Reverse transcriptase Ty1/copia-type domain-containing protein n=1 Tax=Penicillium arizonense TaxID=1835702 RepID=A0A1F5L6B5_PENAI|nr:hypothetical protein PENARI_c026G06050 [Penicillium arizonense]OGE48755.1 hypothetical protein PENARI_c026G06050 [Penicillium arizonense]